MYPISPNSNELSVRSKLDDYSNRSLYSPYNKNVFEGQMNYIRGITDKNIFIGDLKSANDHGLLQRNKITTIISLLDEEDFSKLNSDCEGITYHKFTIADDGEKAGENIIPICEKVKEIIDEIKDFEDSDKDSNILIHCFAGISRSASVVIFYLMIGNPSEILSYSKARKIVKNSRSIIDPIPYYKKQLLAYRENYREKN